MKMLPIGAAKRCIPRKVDTVRLAMRAAAELREGWPLVRNPYELLRTDSVRLLLLYHACTSTSYTLQLRSQVQAWS